MSTGVDPISFEVIRNALVAATDEMVLALKRSAYSTNIKTRSDFSCAFFDAELRSVAQAFTQPVHLGSMVQQVPYAIERYGAENLRPGDAIVTNDPHPRGVHLNDVSLISPVYVDDLLIGYVANLAHHVDVGGGAPASIGAFQEVFQEGVIIPPVKVVSGGRIVDDVFRLILAQIRSKHETAGDFRAQVAANATGVRRITALSNRHGRETLVATMEELLGYTERRVRAEIVQLEPGTYEAEGTVDNDGYTDRAGPPAGSDRDHARRAPLRHVGVGSAAARAGQLDLRDDVLGVRLRAEVPDRPRPAGQRRLLPALQPQRSGRNGDELHLALAGRRRLGDAGPARRGDVPRPPAGVPGAAAGGHQGDDVPGGLRLARHGQGAATRASTRRSPGVTAAGTGATARTRCRHTARTPRTRRSRRPS